MTDHAPPGRRNSTLLRDAHRALRDGDVAAMATMVADDIVWHVAGQSRVSGEYVGRAAVLAYHRQLVELSNGTFSLEDEDLLDSDDRAVSLCRVSGQRDGKALDADYCEVIRVGHGRIVEGWSFAFDQYAFDLFWV
jgi:ketosteroid isomerase-like protein